MSLDVKSTLIAFSFRGIQVPCISTRYGFSQEAASQKYLFKDEGLIQSLGRTNQTFSYELLFDQAVAIPGYEDLFVSTLAEFIDACKDSSAGVLEDPIHGALPAKCASLSYVNDSIQRSGIVVSAEFIHAPADTTSTNPTEIITPLGVSSAAGAFDNLAAKVDWQQEPSPEPTVDILDALTILPNAIDMNINKVAAGMERIRAKMDKVQRSLERVGDVKNWAVWRASQNLKAAAIQTQRNLGADGKLVRQYITKQETTFTGLTKILKNSTQDLLRLNPRLARRTTILANTVVRYFG